jgi:hypothetical protein
VLIELQRIERTPTNKESDTQLIENQHFVIGQENWAGCGSMVSYFYMFYEQNNSCPNIKGTAYKHYLNKIVYCIQQTVVSMI